MERTGIEIWHEYLEDLPEEHRHSAHQYMLGSALTYLSKDQLKEALTITRKLVAEERR